MAYNDAVQTLVLITGSAVLTVYGLYQLGGWHELRSLCGSEMFNLWKPLIPPGVEGTWAPVIEKNAAGEVVRQAWYFNGNFPWLGMAISRADHRPVVLVHRPIYCAACFGAPDQQTARRGSIFAAFLKLFPVYLFIIPGLICFALAKSGKVPGLASMVHNGVAVPQEAQAAFPMMVKYLLPSGLRGIVVAGLLSALMGSLAGVFNACSTLFTVDLYEKWRPKATQHQLVRMGRLATVVMVLIALAWVPVVRGSHGLYEYLQAVQGYLRRRSSWSSFSACSSNVSMPKGVSPPWWSALSSACSACWSTPR